ncbi:MAG: hypothetical protein EXQ96_03285 [Alphaproteobacteria bacterium]|nr:hypothetical protein [Alphaproteobacteria bacterium]
MNKSSSASSGAALAGLIGCRAGSALISFAVAMPVFLGLGVAVVEMSVLTFDYHRAGEAVRRGARAAAMVPALTSLAALGPGQSVECHGTDTGLDCAGTSSVVPADFTTILTTMQAIHPGIQRQNVTIEYRHSGIGDMEQPGGMRPIVTVGLRDLRHAFLLPGAVPGLPADLPLPKLAANQMGVGFRAP